MTSSWPIPYVTIYRDGTKICIFLFQRAVLWIWCIMGFVRLIYCSAISFINTERHFQRRRGTHIHVHDDVIKWKHFPRYWPFVRRFPRSPVNFPHKGQWRGALMFFDLRLNKRLSKQLWGWWSETPSRPLWLHCNDGSGTQATIGLVNMLSATSHVVNQYYFIFNRTLGNIFQRNFKQNSMISYKKNEIENAGKRNHDLAHNTRAKCGT